MKATVTILALTAAAALATGCGSTGGSSVHTKQGAVGGAATGALIGGIIGHQSGRGPLPGRLPARPPRHTRHVRRIQPTAHKACDPLLRFWI